MPAIANHNHSKQDKRLSEYWREEVIREERLHTQVIKQVMDKLRRALRLEVSRGELTDERKDKLIMTPRDFLARSYVKMSIVNLYRRYRRIRIQALTECLTIVGNGNNRDENLEEIRAKIMEAGEAHKASKLREIKENKCAAY
jgi:hypothetical protein